MNFIILTDTYGIRHRFNVAEIKSYSELDKINTFMGDNHNTIIKFSIESIVVRETVNEIDKMMDELYVTVKGPR